MNNSVATSNNMAMIKGDGFSKAISEVMDAQSVAIFVSHAKNQLVKNPKLANCTQESMYQCLMDCAVTGVMPDGRNGYLIPYGNKCTLIIGYQGLISCILKTGRVKKMTADIIHKNDSVKVVMGEVTEHSYDWGVERGDITGAWAQAILSDGTPLCVVMTYDEIEAIRQKSPGKNSEPWTKHWGEMAKKTCYRRLSKILPLTDVQQRVLTADDKQFHHEPDTTQKPRQTDVQEATVVDIENV